MKYDLVAQWFQIASWIGAGLVFVGGIGQTIYQRRGDEQKAQAVAAEKEKQAHQMDQILERVEPIERIAKDLYPSLDRDSALLTLINEVRHKMAPRRMNKAQQEAISAELKKLPRMSLDISVPMADQESIKYASELIWVFKDAGWETSATNFSLHAGPMPLGVILTTKSRDANDVGFRAAAILEKHNVPLQIQIKEDLPENQVALYVGHKE